MIRLKSSRDIELVKLLQEDGRLSFKEVGRILGISHVAARKNYLKLLNKDVIRVQALVNSKYYNYVLIMAEVESYERLHEAVEVFKNCPRTLMVMRGLGGLNLIVLAVAEDPGALKAILLDKCALTNLSSIRRSEVILIDRVLKPRYIQLRVKSRGSMETAPCGKNCSKCQLYCEKTCVGCPATIYYNYLNSQTKTQSTIQKLNTENIEV